ncbi:hypothetical protein [Azospirillum argentinense]|nr:hypothetical protein [Magnetospirillum sp.]
MRDWSPDADYKGRDDRLDAVAGALSCEPFRSTAPEHQSDWRGTAPVVAPSSGWEV